MCGIFSSAFCPLGTVEADNSILPWPGFLFRFLSGVDSVPTVGSVSGVNSASGVDSDSVVGSVSSVGAMVESDASGEASIEGFVPSSED